MIVTNKATRINLFDFKSTPMRTFHITWLSFFGCFFSWFAIAPLMPLIREDLGLTKTQVGNTMIASVAVTILARLLIGWLCDRLGPRRTYTALLFLCAIPVMGIGLANNYETFLLFRLAIGAIGASFVITQYHTSVMFAPHCVGTANATAAGWGNLGGGVTQMVMPLIVSLFLTLGIGESAAWRLSMVIPGLILIVMGFVYYRGTKDFPDGNMDELRQRGQLPVKAGGLETFRQAVGDHRVWVLALIYGASFGIELTMDNMAALYFTDQFHLSMTHAGLIAGLFGLMNIFARALGGIFSDRLARTGGLRARVFFLGTVLFLGGIALIVFSRITVLTGAVVAMVIFGLFVKMANGATYSVVPFVNKKALGAVAGIVGAGGNVGAVLIGFLFRSESLSYSTALFILGVAVMCVSVFSLVIKFSREDEKELQRDIEARQLRTLEPQTV